VSKHKIVEICASLACSLNKRRRKRSTSEPLPKDIAFQGFVLVYHYFDKENLFNASFFKEVVRYYFSNP